MTASPPRVIAALLFAISACTPASQSPIPPGAPPAPSEPTSASRTAPAQRPEVTGRLPHSPADVLFMAGMIPHHAQAIVMAGWAPTRSRDQGVKVLAERIVVAQRDEIGLIRQWLREVGEPVPPADATHHRMTMNGMEHDMLMPGMLSPEEMKQLERSKSVEFDRLFLTFMIRHHEGALTMVKQLFASPGAAQDAVVFEFAGDVHADQEIEIERMQQMLDALPPRSY